MATFAKENLIRGGSYVLDPLRPSGVSAQLVSIVQGLVDTSGQWKEAAEYYLAQNGLAHPNQSTLPLSKVIATGLWGGGSRVRAIYQLPSGADQPGGDNSSWGFANIRTGSITRKWWRRETNSGGTASFDANGKPDSGNPINSRKDADGNYAAVSYLRDIHVTNFEIVGVLSTSPWASVKGFVNRVNSDASLGVGGTTVGQYTVLHLGSIINPIDYNQSTPTFWSFRYFFSLREEGWYRQELTEAVNTTDGTAGVAPEIVEYKSETFSGQFPVS